MAETNAPAPQEIRRRALCPMGKSFDLSVVRQDFLKRCFKVIFVSTRTTKGKYKQTSLLTRKLTKLAPKLIRGLWFLKNIVKKKTKKQATCEWLMCLQTAAMTSGVWKPFKGGVAEMCWACFINSAPVDLQQASEETATTAAQKQLLSNRMQSIRRARISVLRRHDDLNHPESQGPSQLRSLSWRQSKQEDT